VAVGQSGTNSVLVTSGDGLTWTPRLLQSDYGLNGVAYGDGLFVAVGGVGNSATGGIEGTVVTSVDAVTWTERQPMTANQLESIVYGNGQFVAVGLKSGTIISSSDGVNWISHAEVWLNAVAYGNGQFVAAGGYQLPVMMTSADAVTWIWRTPPGGLTYLHSLAYGNGCFVAVGAFGTILQSGSIATLTISADTAAGSRTLSLEGPIGLVYVLQSSTDLVSWRNVTNLMIPPRSVVSVTLRPDSDRLFYRALSQ
jgi:hypothetical protein